MSSAISRSCIATLALLLTTGLGSAFPQEPARSHYADASIALRVGTLGVGLEASKLFSGHFGARAGVNYFKLTSTKRQSDISYDATLKLQAVTALLDFFPSRRGSFHITGGAMTNPAKVNATGKPSTAGTFTINDNTYTTAEVGTLRGRGKFPGLVPYLGIGWGTPARHAGPLVFLFDLGAALGKAKVDLTSTGAATNPTLAADLEAEQRKVQHDVDKYAKIYPTVDFGLAYRF